SRMDIAFRFPDHEQRQRGAASDLGDRSLRKEGRKALFVVDAQDDDTRSNLTRRFHDDLTRLASQHLTDHAQSFASQENDLPCQVIGGISMSQLEYVNSRSRQQQSRSRSHP